MAHPRKADVIVADAEPVARTGLIHLIDSHPALRVCAETDSLPTARDLCARHLPRVLVMDPAMGDGVSFIKDLPRWSRETRVVVLTARGDALEVQRALKAGVCGYVLRRDPVSALMTAVLGALNGERHVGPLVEHLLLDKLASGSVELHDGEMSALSDRERQVFRLIGTGLGTRAMAAELGLSVKTIETHRERIKGKLGLRTATELQRRAVLHDDANANGVGRS